MTLVLVFVPSKYADKIQVTWVRFGTMTLGLAVFSLAAYWKVRKYPLFWAVFLAFLLAHLLIVGHLWVVCGGLSTVTVGLLGGSEFCAMALLLYWVLGAVPDFRRWRGRSPWIPRL